MLLAVVVCCSSMVFGQQITITPDRSKILIGEVFTLHIKVRDLEKSQPIIKWGTLPDTIQAIEIIESSKIDTFEINGLMQYQQTLTCIAFDSGKFTIPPTKFLIKKSSTSATAIVTSPITIQVLPIDVSLMKDYHDIKDIIEPEQEIHWLRYILISICIIVVVALLLYFGNRKSNRQHTFTAISIQEELTAALKALDELEKADLCQHQQVKKHYQLLTGICKNFSQICLKQQLQYCTTDEWMRVLQGTDLSKQELQAALQLFRLCDAVKFAKYFPDQTINTSSINTARHFLKAIANQKKSDAL